MSLVLNIYDFLVQSAAKLRFLLGKAFGTLAKCDVPTITKSAISQGVLPNSGRLCRICRSTIIGLRVKRDLTVDLSQFVNAVKDQLLSFF